MTTTTEFHMPLPAGQYTTGGQFTTSPTQYTLYSSQAQPISPLSSATATPHNSSPNSPRSVISAIPPHTRQLRPPKSPLYVPAVLRPTEPPRRAVKASPMSPISPEGSFDSLINAKPLSRQSTADSGKWGLGKAVVGPVSAEGFGPVTDSPTRGHWKADNEATICDDTTCTRTFTYFNRRHHCRRCGNIFCDVHSAYAVPLDQDANYHPKGYRSRACAFCYSEYKGWEISRSSRSNSESSEDHQQQLIDSPSTPTTPNLNCGPSKRLSGMFGGVQKAHSAPESLAQSVPRDWSWSTF